eukprot:2987157-Ditylum_brightwellii.AAC.1
MMTAKKKTQNIETSSGVEWNAADNNTKCSDGSNDGRNSNNSSDNNEYNETDQMGTKTIENFPASMPNNDNKQMQIKNK